MPVRSVSCGLTHYSTSKKILTGNLTGLSYRALGGKKRAGR
jgi:hypothetical protein